MAKRRARGDGAVYFDDKRKLYIGQIGLGVDENGKRKRKTVYGKTKAEVKEKLKAVEYRVYEGTFVNASGITLYQLTKQIITGMRILLHWKTRLNICTVMIYPL